MKSSKSGWQPISKWINRQDAKQTRQHKKGPACILGLFCAFALWFCTYAFSGERSKLSFYSRLSEITTMQNQDHNSRMDGVKSAIARGLLVTLIFLGLAFCGLLAISKAVVCPYCASPELRKKTWTELSEKLNILNSDSRGQDPEGENVQMPHEHHAH